MSVIVHHRQHWHCWIDTEAVCRRFHTQSMFIATALLSLSLSLSPLPTPPLLSSCVSSQYCMMQIDWQYLLSVVGTPSNPIILCFI